MSKAILVMDMPKNCIECPFRYKSEEMALGNFTYQSLFRCKFEPEDLDEDEGDTVYLNDIMMQDKPEWCPLRELPQKKEVCGAYPYNDAHTASYNIGYNAYIDEIMKGVEENGQIDRC